MTSGQMQRFMEPYNQFSEHDELTLKKLVDECNGKLFCEIGCWTGHSTYILAQRAKQLGGKVIVIDNFKGNSGTPLEEFARDNDVKRIFMDNMDQDGLLNHIELIERYSDDAFQLIEDNSLDFLFIDAGHAYKQVKKDLVNYLPKVAFGGMVTGHDYESETYDENHVDEDYVNGKHHGVIKAVNEILGTVDYTGRMWWKRKQYED